MKQQSNYCKVVLAEATRKFDKEYTYEVPADMEGLVQTGSLVGVPFGRGNRIVQAYVIAMARQEKADFYIKPVSSLLADRPVVTADQIRLAAFMKERYICTYGAALRCMNPSSVMSVGDKKVRFARLLDPAETSELLSAGELDRLGHIRVVEMLLDYGSAPTFEIQSACQVSPAVLKTLEKKGLIQFSYQEIRRQNQDDEIPEIVNDFVPGADQKAAIERIFKIIGEAAEQGTGRECLLHGITGSGKTEVYLQTARQVLAAGKSVIILVPEISLTPQMIGRIRSRFGDEVAVLHSRLTPAQRYEQWQRILRQEVKLVAGARSAIFAPLCDLGLIIIDEEQEGSYKSETHPRYHARDIARIRSHMHSCALILGSATPSVESYYRTRTGKSVLLELPSPSGSAGLPTTTIVGMREELRNNNRSIFSQRLRQALVRGFEQGRQSMIFLNRRGHSGFVLCRSCGQTIKCSSCSVSLTSHQTVSLREGPAKSGQEKLVCHYCGKISKMPTVCPLCGSKQIGRFGVGTQQVEELFARQFPQMRTLRMDQDTTSGRNSHAQLLHQFAGHEADVLIGTQMIAKGHDFANVTTVGILAADQLLGISDFRASERAFQLIVQASGRAGRAEHAGEVIIQAYNTDDYALTAAAAHDYQAFYKQEIAYRQMMKYPPFGSLGILILAGSADNQVRQKLEKLHQVMRSWLSEHPDYPEIEISAPSRAPMEKIRGKYRWRLVMRANNQAVITRFLAIITDSFDFDKLAVTMDVDPWQML